MVFEELVLLDVLFAKPLAQAHVLVAANRGQAATIRGPKLLFLGPVSILLNEKQERRISTNEQTNFKKRETEWGKAYVWEGFQGQPGAVASNDNDVPTEKKE